MKLGLIADIHEQVGHLQSALGRLARESVDQVVVLGDVFETGSRIEETCRLLTEVKAIGVWGNHDFGLCVDPPETHASRYPPVVIDFMRSLKPRLVIQDCHFSHVEPWLNPHELADLWYFDGEPDEPLKVERIFSGTPHRIMFAGHFHRWLLVTEAGRQEWIGDRPLDLAHGRYYAVIGALCMGRFAVFDTASSVLTPCSV